MKRITVVARCQATVEETWTIDLPDDVDPSTVTDNTELNHVLQIGRAVDGQNEVSDEGERVILSVEVEEPVDRWRRMVLDNLIASDGKAETKARSTYDPKVIHFGAYNAICLQRITNRAISQGFDVDWGPKMTGTVRFDG